MKSKMIRLGLVALAIALVALPGAQARTLPGYAVCAFAYCAEDNDIGSNNVTDTRVCTSSGIVIVNVGNDNKYQFCDQSSGNATESG